MIAGDRARVTVYVAVAPDVAFAVFTEEIDQWWRRGPAYRVAGREVGTLHLEPRLGGRVFEQLAGATTALHEVGRIVEWEPPRRLAFDWRSVTFVAGESTLVEVDLTPRGDGTEVCVTHRGWAGIRDDHPVRHGQPAAPFIAGIGRWWGALLTALREHVDRRR